MLVSERVFVYGTLRRGECNHGLLQGACWLGHHQTQPRYTLFDLGAYPAAVAGGVTAIVGELYAVTATHLADLDRLEGYPYEYTRRPISTPHGLAWMYLYRRRLADAAVIASGDWRARRAG